MNPKEDPVAADPNTLYIDINIGEGRKARIIMTPSDDPAVLALQFAKTHNLDKATQKELEDQLHFQKASLIEQ